MTTNSALLEGKCETGCKHYYGGEVRHHPYCTFYPDSMSELLDKAEAQLATRAPNADHGLRSALEAADSMATSFENGELAGWEVALYRRRRTDLTAPSLAAQGKPAQPVAAPAQDVLVEALFEIIRQNETEAQAYTGDKQKGWDECAELNANTARAALAAYSNRGV